MVTDPGVGRPEQSAGGSLHEEIERRVKRLFRGMERFEQEACRLADEVTRLWEAIKRLRADGQGGNDPARRIPPPDGRTRQILEEQARHGVAKVLITPAGSGRARAQIDGGNSVELPVRLGKLLEELCRDEGPRCDGLVGWKNPKQLARALGCARKEQRRTRHALSVSVYRLRERLKAAKINSMLVMFHPEKGYRFALRMEPEQAPDARWGAAHPMPGVSGWWPGIGARR